MVDTYRVRMPLRTPNLQLPNVEINGLTIRETNTSKDRKQADDRDYEIVAEFEADRSEVGQKKTESYGRARQFAHIFSFITGNGILVEEPQQAYSVSRGGLVGTSGTTLFPYEWYQHIEAIFEDLERSVPADGEVLRSLRWYSQSTIQDDDTDAFLSLWLSLEILSNRQEKIIPELDSVSGNPVDEAMKSVRQNVDSDYLKQEINHYIAEKLRDESIPESIERELREALGEQHSIVGEGLLPRLQQLQKDRSNLVHDGKPIDNLKNKKSRLDRTVRFLLKSKLDVAFTGDYDSDFFWEAPQIPFESILHLIMSQYDRPLELDELAKELVAANRDTQILERSIGLFRSSTHERIGIEETEEEKYQFVGFGYSIACPVCDEEFETEYLLAYHLARSDVDQDSESAFHKGSHGRWRQNEGFPANEPATNAIEGWIKNSGL